MRRRQLIMEDWTFTKEGRSEKVNLPHTWNAYDGADGGNDYYRGACTYEKKISLPEFDSETELVFLEFEGVNASASVYFNDQLVTNHDGGYSTFRAEITPYLKEENIIKVIADNSVNDRVYPQKADFTFYGGIYRDVNILIVNKSHFDVMEWGTPGIHVTPELKEDKTASVLVRGDINIESTAEEYMVLIEILDQDGETINQTTVDVSPSDLFVDAEFVIEEPHLWNGRIDPYLYTVTAVLYEGTKAVDAVGCDFGVRSFKIDSKKGFILNGQPYPLHGVSRHQDRKNHGNAISYEMMEEDMELIKEVGANSIRLAHYQHNQYFYDLCDREGMVVWAEIPYISGYLENGDENSRNQMTELIIQNYNHPSIVTWGLSNEITIDYAKSRGKNIENHKVLNDLVHKLDPSRPTVMACFAMCTPFHGVTRIADAVGWNLYLGWYIPGFFLNHWFISFFHFIRPRTPLCYSEYGAEGMPNLHSDNIFRGDNTEEYQCLYHEYMLKCFEKHPYMWATYVWNMFDFAADARDQGGEPGMNHKGLVTFDRRIKKDAFYLYKAWWTKEEFVHICSKRFKYRKLKVIPVKVYSNAPSVTLYVDGKQLFTEHNKDNIFVFPVPIGENTKIKAVAGDNYDEAEFTFSLESHPEYEMPKKKKDATSNWM